jgi:putative SOS response-associated peptidase YedK
MYIKLASGKPFAFAGLWEIWHSPDGSVIPSATIITTHPNSLMEPIHNRMPAILPQEAYETWLTPGEQDTELLSSLLKPYPPEAMVAYPVSTLVNDPKNELPDCILPLAES